MHLLWILLLGLLLGQCSTGPGVEPTARALAGVAALALLVRERRTWGWVLLALALGTGLGLELELRVRRAQRWEGFQGPARVQLIDASREGRAPAWLGAPGLPPARAWVSGLGREPRPAGARGVLEIRTWLPPARRNPDDRNRTRSSLQRGILVRGRSEGRAAWLPEPATRLSDPRQRAVERLRTKLRTQMGEGAELWVALLLGNRDRLPEGVQERFRFLGLAHLLALSGLHVGLLAALMLRALRVGREAPRALWILPPLGLWAWMAGMGPSLLRAFVVLGWILVGRRLGREHRAVDGLAAAGALELLLRPASVVGLAWWLSYAATLVLIRVAEGGPRRAWIRAALAVCLAPWATSPWVLSAFGRMPLAGPAWNLVVGPVFAVFMGLGVGIVVASLLVPPLAPGLISLLALGNHALGWLLRVLAGLDPGALGHPGIHGTAWAAALTLLAVILVPGMPGRTRTRLLLGLGILAAVHLPLLRPVDAEWWSLDVGQGDGGVLRLGRSRWLVVDAGNGPYDGGEERVILPYLMRRNARGVDLLISHGHRDHYGGAPSLLRSGRVATLHLARTDSGRSWTLPLLEISREQGVRISWLERGDRWVWKGWSFSCLWPEPDATGMHGNDRSLVLRCGAPRDGLLLTGDLEAEAERSLLAHGDSLRIGVLKVAHHGSRTGTGDQLLLRVGPGVALISCGVGNRYGHPHARTLEALEEAGWELLRSDERGAVGVVWRGGRLRTRCVRPPP